MATRIGLAQQNGGSEVNANTICDSAAISACEKSHGKRSGSAHHLLECGIQCLREEPRMATRIGLARQNGVSEVMRTPFAIVRQSMSAR